MGLRCSYCGGTEFGTREDLSAGKVQRVCKGCSASGPLCNTEIEATRAIEYLANVTESYVRFKEGYKNLGRSIGLSFDGD